MRAACFVLLASFLVVLSCARDLDVPTGDDITSTPAGPAVVEGSVVYFEGARIDEMFLPPGLRLTKCRWISCSGDSALPVYVCGAVDSSHVNLRVRAFGSTNKKRLGGSDPTSVYYVVELNVDSLQVVNPLSS